MAGVDWSAVALVMTSSAAVLSVGATFVRGAQSDRVNQRAAQAARDASDRVAGIDAMKEMLSTYRDDNVSLRDEIRTIRIEHRQEIEALTSEYRGRIRELSDRISAVDRRADECEAREARLRSELATLRRR